MDADPYEVYPCRGHWHVGSHGDEIITDAGSVLDEATARSEAARMNAEWHQSKEKLEDDNRLLRAARDEWQRLYDESQPFTVKRSSEPTYSPYNDPRQRRLFKYDEPDRRDDVEEDHADALYENSCRNLCAMPLPRPPRVPLPRLIVPTESFQLAEVRRLVEQWIAMRGHNRCWYAPEILNPLMDVLGYERPTTDDLPPRAEFEIGCARFRNDLYGTK